MSAPEEPWLYFAAQDLRTAELTLREGIFAQTCFHCQQAVEKALKALVSAQAGRTPPRTHSIADLLQLLPATNRKDAPADLAPVLDTYYVMTRYPDAVVGPLPDALPSRQDAEQALDLARRTLRWVEGILDEM